MPVSFAVAALVGMVLERTVIRFLYGRPLETLLATWGISLILMQTVRTIFGAQNVPVENPSWMSGGIEAITGVVLPWSRVVIIGFAAFVLVLIWLLLTRTRLGLFVRAVTQNRAMASCTGVPTGRVDMWAFGLGSGLAGLAGCALSQIGNVGPDLGQSYIVDSFMVVVLGGVGQLAGTVYAAMGLGIVNKFLEAWSGAVLAKIAVLVFIIMFIQKRPQGLFALKGHGEAPSRRHVVQSFGAVSRRQCVRRRRHPARCRTSRACCRPARGGSTSVPRSCCSSCSRCCISWFRRTAPGICPTTPSR